MKYTRALFLILIFLSSSAFAQEEKHGKKFIPLYMGIPHQEVLSHLPPGAEFYGDFKNIVSAGVDRERKTLRFRPKAPGLGTLTVHDRKGKKLFEYRIEVRRSQLTKVVREVRGLLSDIEGITIKIVNNKVVIDGKVLLPKDLNRIYGVIKQFDGQVASLVEINPIAQKKIAEIIERDINNPDIEVRAVNGKFILKGIANNDAEKARAEIIAKTYVPPPVINEAEAQGVVKKRKELVVINLLGVRAPPPREPKKIVQLIVHYVELSKRYLRSSSFEWRPSLEDQTQIQFTKDTTGSNSGGIVSSITGVISGLLPKLNWMKRHGFARVLKSTSVVVEEGQKGLVVSESRIPFVVRQPNNQGNTTQFANVGVNSEITPSITNSRSDLIQLNMLFRVSALNGATAAGPLVDNNQVQTIVSVRSGQSAAVGGLISNTTNTDYNPDDNPPGTLISLYASKDFRRNKSQFVIFVTPIIKASASAGSEKIKQKFRLRD